MDKTADIPDPDLYARAQQLLAPGEIELAGVIVHTEIPGDKDMEMTQLTIDVGEVIDTAATDAETDTYVYSGSDDPEFASNQHQGRTLDDEFVWECQQLLRDGTYDLIFYFEADTDPDNVATAVSEKLDVTTVGITEP